MTVDERDWLAKRFEADRTRLRTVAYRMLGSLTEADDAVQETWLRLSRYGADGVENLGGWLTTVVARVCLDMLRTRRSRREEPVGVDMPAPAVSDQDRASPEDEALLADSVGLALLVVLDTLAPPERVAFVLHDMFAVPFDEIGPIVGRSPVTARQLASRARRRVQGVETASDPDLARQRDVVGAFMAAAREGDFGALLALLDPDVVLRADPTVVQMGGVPREIRGPAEVAGAFCGRARALRPALVNGAAGAVWTLRGEPRVVFTFTVTDGKITQVEQIGDPDRLDRLGLAI